MKVIIAGSRGITNGRVIEQAIILSKYDITEVVSGTARGVDQLGETWATMAGRKIKRFPANWEAHGKKAGFLRNVDMSEYADALIAIWDGESRGTMHMIDIMKKARKPVFVMGVPLPNPSGAIKGAEFNAVWIDEAL